MRIRACGLLGLLWCVAFSLAPLAPAATPPDIYLITIDTLRADHVPCYGYTKLRTPALDTLCHDGVRFSEAFTPAPITNSSHATILTGLYPSSHGVTDFGVPLAASHVTWAELLKQRGYHTAAFIGAVILDSKSLAPGFDRGFSYYDNFPATSVSKSRWGRVERRGMDVVDRAERWLNTHPAGPHFVWVHLYDPHDPYEPPPPYSQTYRERPYDGEIAYADHALGEFIGYLQRRGWYQNAIIVVVGDHGEGLGEHKEETHGIFLYDSTLHVPLIVTLPGRAFAGKTVAAQVRTTDLLPTIVDLLGISTSAHFDGSSLVPYWRDNDSKSRSALGETDYPLRFGWAPLRSMCSDGMKFIEAPKPEFYDLHSDPGETRNLYEPWNEHVQSLRAMLASMRKAAPASPSRGAVPSTTVDELKALGYLGAEGATDVPEPSMLPDPKDKIEVQNLLHSAMLASESGQTAEARTALLQAIQADPQSSAAFVQLGQLELRSGDNSRAAEHLRRARELRPDDATAALSLGQALEKSGDLAGARQALESSLKLVPGQFEARRLLGSVDARLGALKEAEDQFEAALFLQPNNAATRVEYARVLLADKNYAKAAAQLEEATKLDPRNLEAWKQLQTAYQAQGNRELAAKAAARASSLEKTPH